MFSDEKTSNPREEESQSDFQSFYILLFKCSVSAKDHNANKGTGKYGSFKGTNLIERNH